MGIIKDLKTVSEKLFRDLGVKKNQWKDIPNKEMKKLKSAAGRDLTDELFDMIAKTYAPIGGHVDYKKPDDLPGDADLWKAADVDSDPEPDVVNFYKKKPAGYKSVGSGSDGGDAAKKALIQSKVKELNTKGYFGEVSGAIAHVLITRHDIPYVDNEADVRKALGGKDIEWVGANPNGKYPSHTGWYYRKIGPKKHLKIMVGKPRV